MKRAILLDRFAAAVYRCFRKIAKSGYWILYVCLSVLLFLCPRERTRLSLDGFPLNSKFEHFSKICQKKNSSFIKAEQKQRVLHMKSNIHFFIISRSITLRMRNVSSKSCRRRQNTHFMFNNFFFVPFIIWYWRTGQATDDSMAQLYFSCWIPKAANTHSEYVIRIAFPLQQWLHEGASLFYKSIICLILTFIDKI